jgi:hypothetical protein
MEVEGFVNVTGANLHARRFGGSCRLDVVLERVLAYFLGKLSGAHVSSVPLHTQLLFVRPLGSSFLKLVGLEFPTYYVARVDLSEMLPLLRQVI